MSHVKAGLPCQDAHRYAVTDGGLLVLAVADGAGSAAQSEIGATVAVTAAIEAIVAALGAKTAEAVSGGAGDEARWREWIASAFAQARAAVITEAGMRQAPVRDFATTLLLAVVSEGSIAAGQVGDGSIIAVDASGAYRSLTIPSRGEYVNETTFLTTDGALEKMQIAVWRSEAAHVAALSDGLQMLALKMATGEAHPPFFEPLFRFLQKESDESAARGALEGFLRSPRIADRADDDLTLLLATRILPQAAFP